MSIRPIFNGRTQKVSESLNDCQDFFHIQQTETEIRFAIADGSSRSFYPSLWAELLVNHFCDNPNIDQENWQNWLKPIQAEWFWQVREKVEKAKSEFNPVWVTNTNRLNCRDSATSTFIGLRFLQDKIRVSMVGDSCLFILKNYQLKNSLLGTYLLKNSQDFGDRPEYFASYCKNNDFQPEIFDIPFEYQETSDEKFYFILATDALAEFIFKCIESKETILSRLLQINSQQKFENFVESARNSDGIKMKNDDVTLMILEVTDLKIIEPLPSISPQSKDNKLLLPATTEGKEESKNLDKEESTAEISEDQKNNQNEEDFSSKKFFKVIKNQITETKNQTTTQLKVFIAKINPFQNKQNLDATNNNEQIQIKALSKENSCLKGQRNIFAALALFLPLLTYYYLGSKTTTVNSDNKTSTSTNSNLSDNQNNTIPPNPVTPQIKESNYHVIPVNTNIYKDQELSKVLIESTKTEVKVLIIETGDKWNKIKRTVYAHKNTSTQENCLGVDIELNENIRLSPAENGELFGTLKEQSTFKNLDINNKLDWCKFNFEGYIKK